MKGDIAAGKMIFGVEGVDPQRRQQLIDLLEVDLEWRLNKVSDGQRRRVQICMGLLKPYQVCSNTCCSNSCSALSPVKMPIALDWAAKGKANDSPYGIGSIPLREPGLPA